MASSVHWMYFSFLFKKEIKKEEKFFEVWQEISCSFVKKYRSTINVEKVFFILCARKGKIWRKNVI